MQKMEKAQAYINTLFARSARGDEESSVRISLLDFTPDELRLIGRTLTDHPEFLPIFMEDRIAVEKYLEDSSYTDELTGFPNLRYFNDELKNVLKRRDRMERESNPGATKRYAVLVADLVNMKAINDKIDYNAGNEAIRTFSRTLPVRAGETFARIGGDEFVVLLTSEPGDEEFIVGALTRFTGSMVDATFKFKDQEYPLRARFGMVEIKPGMDAKQVMELVGNKLKDIKQYTKGREAANAAPQPVKSAAEIIRTAQFG